MADVDRFRSVMRTTESFIIGNFTIAFLTANDLRNYIEIFFDKEELKRSWFKFFREEDKICTNGKGLIMWPER